MPLAIPDEEGAPTDAEGQASEVPGQPDFNLRNYEPCGRKGQGLGTIDAIWTQIDGKNRFVMVLPVTGVFGDVGITSLLEDKNHMESNITLEGFYNVSLLDKQVSEGPVSHVSFVAGEERTAVTVSYKPGQSWKAVEGEFLCKEGALAVRLTFTN
jgi:hypothetical protein